MKGVVLIHAGAGYHSVSKEPLYIQLCNEACQRGIDIIKSGRNAADTAVEVMRVLEASPLTNAGRGSSLNIKGDVECDASLMTSDGYFGAVSSVSGLRQPITLAADLLKQQHHPPPDGRIPPSCLVGAGAVEYARMRGFETCDPKSLITESALKKYEKYIEIVGSLAPPKNRKRQVESDAADVVASKNSKIYNQQTTHGDKQDDRLLDTVGVVCIDTDGFMASALSSGGIALKHPGRMGQSAMIGSGCWVNEYIAVATSGSGEQLMRTLLARTISDDLLSPHITADSNALPVTSLDRCIKQKFINDRVLIKDKTKLAGAIIILLSQDKSQAELLWTHTTRSMCVAHMTSTCAKPTATISRLPENKCDKTTQVCSTSGVAVTLALS